MVLKTMMYNNKDTVMITFDSVEILWLYKSLASILYYIILYYFNNQIKVITVNQAH